MTTGQVSDYDVYNSFTLDRNTLINDAFQTYLQTLFSTSSTVDTNNSMEEILIDLGQSHSV